MRNPYDVLGVNESASDEELNKAYKALARKYHPDMNSSPEAGQKMVEINCAYDEIKKMREAGQTFASRSAENAYGASSDRSAGSADTFAYAEQAIREGRLFEAFTLLQLLQERNGRWYYDMAVIYAQTGAIPAAKETLARAVSLEPENAQYLALKQRLDALKEEAYYSPYARRGRAFLLWKIVFWILFLTFLISCIGQFLH